MDGNKVRQQIDDLLEGRDLVTEGCFAWPRQVSILRESGVQVFPFLVEFFHTKLSSDYAGVESKPGLAGFIDILVEVGDAGGGQAYLEFLNKLPGPWAEAFAVTIARFAIRHRRVPNNALPMTSVRWVLALAQTTEAIVEAQEECREGLASHN
jgi:hypothetical protein